MKRNTLSAIVAGALLSGASMAASADTMSKADFKAEKTRIEATQDTDLARCKQLSGNANDICKLEAKGAEKVAMADLNARNKATKEAAYDARVVRAKADYAVAKEKCDDLAGNDKDVCVKKAKSAEVAALADAKANKKIVAANVKANETIVDAKTDASKEKLEAQYKVATEKCESLAGETKDACVKEAKRTYGKS
jgi:hypothetical protein